MKPVAIFRHAATEGPGYLAEFLDSGQIPWRLIAIDEGAVVPPSAAAYSGLVFMGGPMSVNDDLPWLTAELDLIRDAVARDVPVLGHCLGAQLIAKALGGVVSRNCVNGHGRKETPDDENIHASSPHPNPLPQAGEGTNESLCEFYVTEIGWGEVTVADNETARRWFGDLQTFDAFHWHGETFTLPPGAEHLLSGAYCINQGYAIGPHLGLQCHIEMTAEMVTAWCEAGAIEVAAKRNSPAVQSADEMQQQMADKLPQLHLVAARLYTQWIGGLNHERG